MADAPAPDPAATPGRCPWCSAELLDPTAPACPSCGATLVGDGEQQVPGVNALDAEAILRAARGARPKSRSRILSWMSGETADDDPSASPPDSLAPPPPEVQREMLRLELQAEVADLEGEASTVIAEAEIEAREAGWEPPGPVTDEEPAPSDVAANAADDHATPAAEPSQVPDPRS